MTSAPSSSELPAAVPVEEPPRRMGLQLTRHGRTWLVIVGVLLAVGIGKNINLLALLGYAMLAILALSVAVVGRRLRTLEARRFLLEEYHAGVLSRIEVRLRNPGDRSCHALRLEDAGPGHRCLWQLDQVAAGARHACVAEVVLPRRGWYEFAPLTVSSTYPFGLACYHAAVGPAARVLVLPRIGRLSRERLRAHLFGIGTQPERLESRGRRHESSQAEFHGLRAYRPGDSPRWIHWRTSARRGQLVVREFEDLPGDDLVIVVDPRAATPEAYDDAITLAATLVHEWCQHRGDQLTLFLPGTSGEPTELADGVTGPEHGRRLQELLATRTAVATDTLVALDDIAGPLAPAAVLVVSAGRSDLPEQLERQAGRRVTHLDVSQQQEWGFYTPP